MNTSELDTRDGLTPQTLSAFTDGIVGGDAAGVVAEPSRDSRRRYSAPRNQHPDRRRATPRSSSGGSDCPQISPRLLRELSTPPSSIGGEARLECAAPAGGAALRERQAARGQIEDQSP